MDEAETLWFGPPDHPGRGGLPMATNPGDITAFMKAYLAQDEQAMKVMADIVETVPTLSAAMVFQTTLLKVAEREARHKTSVRLASRIHEAEAQLTEARRSLIESVR